MPHGETAPRDLVAHFVGQPNNRNMFAIVARPCRRPHNRVLCELELVREAAIRGRFSDGFRSSRWMFSMRAISKRLTHRLLDS